MNACKMPANFADLAHMPNRVLIPMLNTSQTALTRWRNRVGKPNRGGGQPFRQAPANFVELLRGGDATNCELAKALGTTTTVIARWRYEAGFPTWARRTIPKVEKGRKLLPIPKGFRLCAQEMGVLALERRYGASFKTIHRWLTELGMKPVKRSPKEKTRFKGYRTMPVKGRMALPGWKSGQAQHIEVLAGHEEAAAQYLRAERWIVHKCGPKGGADHKGEFWRVGSVVCTGAELLARAEAKGFDPLAWARLAA